MSCNHMDVMRWHATAQGGLYIQVTTSLLCDFCTRYHTVPWIIWIVDRLFTISVVIPYLISQEL